MRIQYEKSVDENAIAESSFSGLPKCVCKRAGIKPTCVIAMRSVAVRFMLICAVSGTDMWF